MRLMLLIVASAIAGGALGLGTTWARFRRAAPPAESVVTADGKIPFWSPESGPQPRLHVESDEHNFGTVAAESVVTHAFRVTNHGQYPLVLQPGGTSCQSCTIGRIGRELVPPGESTDITVEYRAAAKATEFRKSAYIRTNDRGRQPFTLTVTGKVLPAVDVSPQEVTIASMPAGKARTVELRLAAHFSEKLEVVRHEFRDARSAEHFQIEVTPLAAEELGKLSAKSGFLVRLSIDERLPLGRTEQALRLHTNLAGTIDVPIDIKVTGDLVVGGSAAQGWNASRGILMLGSVRQSEGSRRELAIVVRGPERDSVQVQFASANPEWLKVTVGPGVSFSGGSAVRFPLAVEVPAGSPLVNHLGVDPARWGSVTLTTTHPSAKELRIPVSFAVEP